MAQRGRRKQEEPKLPADEAMDIPTPTEAPKPRQKKEKPITAADFLGSQRISKSATKRYFTQMYGGALKTPTAWRAVLAGLRGQKEY